MDKTDPMGCSQIFLAVFNIWENFTIYLDFNIPNFQSQKNNEK